MLLLRTVIYYILIIPLTIFYVLLSLLICILPFPLRYKIISSWARIHVWLLKVVCGIDYRIAGKENIPEEASIIMCNHQSAWETLALQFIFPPQVWVLKRELLWIPIIGWGIATLKPIAINRKAGGKALAQVVEQGTERLKEGIWVTIFPEGTRIEPGKTRRYGKSGGVLAETSRALVVPVAHNAGLLWAKNSFVKRPGVIDMVIGPVIETTGKDSDQITEEARQWIEPMVKKLLE